MKVYITIALISGMLPLFSPLVSCPTGIDRHKLPLRVFCKQTSFLESTKKVKQIDEKK